MKKLFTDLKNLIRNHWKITFIIFLAFYFVQKYPDVKQGILDGWMNK